jgi:hypothetical protein
MSSEQLLERVLSTGVWGIKKTDLKREFNSLDVDKILEGLSKSGKVCIDKKGTSYYCWTNEAYVQHIVNSDPKFKILFESINSLENKLDVQTKAVKTALANTIDLFTNNENEKLDQITVNSTLDLESFKIEFDEFLTKINNSIGWVELSRARSEITSKHTMSQREFYDFVDQLINKYQDEYELSTGGEEGIVVRGLLHGYIRCIQVN